MADSIREQCLARFFALLDPLPYFHKHRMSNWDVVDIPALIQIDGGGQPLGGDDASSGISGIVRVGLRVSVALITRADFDIENLGPHLSQVRADVISAVTSDPTLGGLAENVRWDNDEDPEVLLEEGAPPNALFIINFIIIHTEAEGNPYATM